MDRIIKWFGAHWAVALGLILCVYFALRAIYFVFAIDYNIPPDEVRRLNGCLLFAKSVLMPVNSHDSSSAEIMRYNPYLYYFIIGKLLNFNVFGISDLIFIRLVSVVFGVLTVIYGWRWIRLFSSNHIVQVLFLTMLTNTLMFTVMCSSVSYDSLTNLMAAMTVYYFTRFIKECEPWMLVAFICCMLGGLLTKVTFLPLAAILVVCLAIHERKSLILVPKKILSYLKSINCLRLFAVATLSLLLILNIILYGGNLVRFGKFIPSPSQVLSEEQIMKNGVMARDMICSQYRNREISFSRAIELAKQINHATDSRDTIALINDYEQKRRVGWKFTPDSRVRYAFIWSWMMMERGFGMLGHRIVYQKEAVTALYALIFIWAIAMIIRNWHPNGSRSLDSYILLIVMFYIFILMQFVNYQYYLKWENAGFAVQGRYIFPVLVPLYGIVAHYLIGYLPKLLQIIGFIGVFALFVYGDFFFFLKYVQPVIVH